MGEGLSISPSSPSGFPPPPLWLHHCKRVSPTTYLHRTLTWNSHLAMLPASSLALQVMSYSPTSNSPGSWVQLTCGVDPELSIVFSSHVTSADLDPISARKTKECGQRVRKRGRCLSTVVYKNNIYKKRKIFIIYIDITFVSGAL